MPTGAAWLEADQLFRSDRRWLGTDDAYSVPLGGNRTLWLFGDTFLGHADADAADAGRAGADFVSNTIAVQTGLDPSSARLERWPVDPGAQPVFTSTLPGEWRWPLDGRRVGDALLIFCMRVRSTRPDLGSAAAAWAAEGSLGFFDVVGSAAYLVSQPDRPPREWRPVEVTVPETDTALGTALLLEGDHLLAFGQRDGQALLARWPAAEAAAGLLTDPQWWCGDTAGWRHDHRAATPVVDEVPTEFTVHRHDATTLVLTQVGDPVDRGAIEIRTASRPEGPWSTPVEVYRPPEADRDDDTICYAGKAHPELAGGGLVVTYATIRMTREATLADDTVYRPRFARVDLDRELAGAGR